MRILSGSLVAFVFVSSAAQPVFAQNEQPSETQTTTTETSTTTTPPAPASNTATVGETATPSSSVTETTAPEPMPEDTGRRHQKLQAIAFGVQGGIGFFTESGPFGTDTGIGLALAPGYNLGLRASFEILPWLAIDARGQLLHNDGNAFVNYGSLTTLGGLGAVRFTAPLHYIRPYVLAGFGGYHLAASGTNTLLTSDSVSAFELGLGAAIPTGRNIEVGVEYLYNHLNSEVLSNNMNADGGDPTTLSVFVQYRLPI